MTDSTTMRAVPARIRARFNATLTTRWLRGRRIGARLYCGSVHGMTARAFHAACDGWGPTLTLIRADVGGAKYVFGGYTSAPWNSPASEEFVGCADAFLFSVTSPHRGGRMVRFPLQPRREGRAMYCHPGCGPTFGDGWDLVVYCGASGDPDASFDCSSYCGLSLARASYQDVLCKGNGTFTGAHCFTPVDVEVYAVVW